MQKLIKQTVYLPVNGDYPKYVVDDEIPEFYDTVEPQEGYFFTPEQLNQLLSDVIKDALDTGADKAETECDEGGETGFVNKKSITDTFDITYQKHKV